MKSTRAKLPTKIYNYIYRRVPRLCVDAIIRDRRGIVLSLRDIPPDRGQWHFPGGKVALQERLEAAVKRICREETGLAVKIERILGAIEYPRLGFGGAGHSVSVAFLVRPVSGQLRGSVQARRIAFFRTLPRVTEHEVRRFLIEHKLIKR